MSASTTSNTQSPVVDERRTGAGRNLFSRAVDGWLAYWFAPQSPFNLAVCRVLFFGAMFLLYLPQDFSLWASVTDALWSPTFLFMLPLLLVGEPALNIMQIVWKAALLLSCLGLFTRASTVTSFVLGLYLLGLPHNFGKVYHNDALLVFVFGILMASRCGDALSLDRRLGLAQLIVSEEGEASGEYRWPIRAVWLVFALIFFAAGVAKLRNSGLAWVFSENMSVLLIKQQYDYGALVNWGVWFAQSPWLYSSLAATTLLLEAGYPLALVSRRARWIFVPGMFLAQVGIRVLMGPWFIQFLISTLFWVPWNHILPQRWQRQTVDSEALSLAQPS